MENYSLYYSVRGGSNGYEHIESKNDSGAKKMAFSIMTERISGSDFVSAVLVHMTSDDEYDTAWVTNYKVGKEHRWVKKK